MSEQAHNDVDTNMTANVASAKAGSILRESDPLHGLSENQKLKLRVIYVMAALVYTGIVVVLFPMAWACYGCIIDGSLASVGTHLLDGASWIPTFLYGLFPIVIIAAVGAPLVWFALGALFAGFELRTDLVRFGGYVAATTAFVPTSLIATAYFPEQPAEAWDEFIPFVAALFFGPVVGTIACQFVLIDRRWPKARDLQKAAIPRFGLAHLMLGVVGLGFVLGMMKLEGALDPILLAIVAVWIPYQWCTTEAIVLVCRRRHRDAR